MENKLYGTYKQRKLIEGWRLKPISRHIKGYREKKVYCAPPDSKFINRRCRIIHKEESMTVSMDDVLYKTSFDDRWHPKKYTLCYLEWEPGKGEQVQCLLPF